jgi:hypothetical protein
LADVKSAIDDNRAALYLSNMGAINFRTGEPVPLIDRSLLGSTFELETIKIVKRLVVDGIATGSNESVQIDPQDDDLHKLIQVLPDHHGLAQASNRLKALKHINTKLCLTRDLFESVVASCPEGPLFRWKLKDGHRGCHISSRGDDTPSWTLEPSTTEEATVLLSSLAYFSVSLSGIPICSPKEMDRPSFLGDAPGFVLAFGHGVYKVAAVFFFDESCHEFSADDNFIARVNLTLAPVYETGRQMVTRLDGVTVRLVFLQIGLTPILQAQLDLLGIDTSVSAESEEDHEEARNRD